MSNSDRTEKTKRVPFDLPSDWTMSTLEEISQIIMGQSPPSSAYNTKQEGLPFFQGKAEFASLYPEAVKWCTQSAKVAQKGDVLISVRAPVGPTNLAPSECCIGRGLAAIRPLRDIPSKYVLYYLRSIESDIESLGTGTTFKAISGQILRSLPVPLAPSNQQKLIVEEIEQQFSRLDEAVASLKRAKASLKRYKAAVLKAAVEGKLSEQWRKEHPDVEPASELLERILTERRKKWEEVELVRTKGRAIEGKDSEWKKKYNAPVNPYTSDLPKLPDGWKWATVDQLAEAAPNAITDGPFGSNLKTEHYTSSGPRVIRLQNIGSGEFIDEKAHISEDRFQRLLRYSVRPHDVIVAALGKPAPRACLVPAMLGKALVKADCIRFRTATSLVSPGYVMYALNSEPIQKRTDKIVHGVGRPRLNLKEIKGISLPLPPKEEQDEIFDEVERRFSVTREMESELERNLRRAERLRQAILKKAFSGELIPWAKGNAGVVETI